MDTEIVVTVIAGVLLAVAALGTVFPVLPGSLLTVGTLLAWSWILGSTASWTMGLLGIAVALVGWTASTVLTGRNLKQQQIPKGSTLVALLAAIVGMFLIPVVGLFVGFGVGLLGSELVRRRNFPEALRASGSALKAAGTGILVEFGCAAMAASLWVVGVIWHFNTR
jgi:uncharacterized protein YqgC (DUF456 family)